MIFRTAVMRMGELSHPSLLKVVQILETDYSAVVVTEKVSILREELAELSFVDIARGLQQISSVYSFLHCDANLKHSNICLSSVFVGCNGDWKLAGLEYSIGIGREASTALHVVPQKYKPPEENLAVLESQGSPSWAGDTWGFGCLIWEIFNSESSNLNFSLQNIPHILQAVLKKCLAKNPWKRPSPGELVSLCQEFPLVMQPSSVIPHSSIPTSSSAQKPNTDVAVAVTGFSSTSPLPVNEKPGNLGVKTFVCPICSKSYVQRQHLRRHVEKDHKSSLAVLIPKKFKCTLCVKSYGLMRTLKRHIMNDHGDSEVSEE